MDLQEFSRKFQSFSPRSKVRFMHQKIHTLKESEKISFLLSLVRDRGNSPLVRSSALTLLSKTTYEKTDIYQAYIDDPSTSVAKVAQKSLREQKKKNHKTKNLSETVLRKIRSSGNMDKRLKIIKSITPIKDSWVSEVLLEALDDPSEVIRDFIIDDLGKRDQVNPNLFYKKLNSPPWYAKSAVLKALGIRKDPESINLIQSTLEDTNAEVRRSAAQALGKIGGEEALILLNRLAKDSNLFVRKSAEEALNKVSHLKFS